MIGNSNGFTLPHGGAAFAGTYAVDSLRVLASTRLSMVVAVAFYTTGERQLLAGLTEEATKE
jgi:ABC-type glycerol-3-phosphate transport system permease component